MKKTLYLMRHGQTLFNLRKKIQGWSDSPLTEEGRRQAEYAKRYFENNNIIFDHAYSSTQERASDTLELVTDLPYKRLKGIKEMNFGIFEGENEDLHPPRPSSQKTFEDYYVKFGGESADFVRDRVNDTLTKVMEADNHQNVLAVSHAGACFFFTLKWFPQLSSDKVRFSNCCILKFEYEFGQFEFIEAIEHDFSKSL